MTPGHISRPIHLLLPRSLPLPQLQTGHLNFLPRLGSSLTSLTPSSDGLALAVVTSANRLRLISPMDQRTRWEMRGLAYAAVEGRYNIRHVRLWAAGTQHPGTLITNALPGQLQVRHRVLEKATHQTQKQKSEGMRYWDGL